uniref:FMRFamide n=1 Tax=Arion vulgaris TaxID=1028688 RepID=A0A0B7B869_9EUPU
MSTFCLMGMLALLCLTCMSSLVFAEGENRNNEYLRFGRENNGGYIRFGRNDPFLRFGKKSDPFLRFGRQDPFLRFGRQDPFLRFGREDPFLRFGRNDPYLRFGRSDPFLRFGKSSDAEIESDVDAVTLSREHGIAEENDVSDRRKRSVLTEQVKDSVSKQATTKAVKYGSNVKTMPRKVSEAESGAREIRSGQYMRFGKKNQADVQDDSYDRHFLESEFSRFLRNYSPKISLPRFGKRNEHNIERKQEYMRFGRGSHGI